MRQQVVQIKLAGLEVNLPFLPLRQRWPERVRSENRHRR